jgi:hypothetical protein
VRLQIEESTGLAPMRRWHLNKWAFLRSLCYYLPVYKSFSVTRLYKFIRFFGVKQFLFHPKDVAIFCL